MNVLLAIDEHDAIVHEDDFTTGLDTIVQVHEEAAAIECLNNLDSPRIAILAFKQRETSTSLSRQIRKLVRTQSTYVIIVSDGSAQTAAEILAAGADDYVLLNENRHELAIRFHAARELMSGETMPALTRSALQTLSVRDPLTSLLSRRRLISDLENQLLLASSNGLSLSCLLADIDEFKTINDTAGHLVGDEVLRNVADVLVAEAQQTDLVYRYGGDEFLVIMPTVAGNEAVRVADAIRKRISTISEAFAESSITTSASVGVASWNAETETPIRLLQQADAALLAAKRAGRDRTVSFGRASS